jgi:YVTN family beta-propeller protein
MAVFVIASVMIAPVYGQSSGAQHWVGIYDAGTSPPGRTTHTAVYDDLSDRLMIFGGYSLPANCAAHPPGGSFYSDVWVLSDAAGFAGTSSWTDITPASSGPAPRMHHTSVYDPSTNRMIVFGGIGSGGSAFNDVWVLDRANGLGGPATWTQLTATNPPPQRKCHSAVYDRPTNRMIVFGGAVNSTLMNDVWVLDHANGTGGTPAWTQLSPTGTPPSPRADHAAVHHAAANSMVVFGGGNPGPYLNDVWVLQFANGLGGASDWVRLTPAGVEPAPRAGAGAAFDTATNRMMVFSGDVNGAASDDAWLLDGVIGASAFWAPLIVDGTPPPRRQPAVAYDTANRLIVFGGDDILSGLDDTWVLTNANGRENASPTANAGPDRLIEIAGSPVVVTLDGSSSADVNGDLLAFEWHDAAGNVVGTGRTANVTLGNGSHLFTLIVTDSTNLSGSDTVTIGVRYTTLQVPIDFVNPASLPAGAACATPAACAIAGGDYAATVFAIPPGVTVNVIGSRPLVIAAESISVAGTLAATSGGGGGGTGGSNVAEPGGGGYRLDGSRLANGGQAAPCCNLAGGGGGGNGGGGGGGGAPGSGFGGGASGAGGAGIGTRVDGGASVSADQAGRRGQGGAGGGAGSGGAATCCGIQPGGGGGGGVTGSQGDAQLTVFAGGGGGGHGGCNGGNCTGGGQGGAGGGAIKLSSEGTLTVTGLISVNGTDGTIASSGGYGGGGGGGAGGTIWLSAPIVTNTGSVQALGGNGGGGDGGFGGGGGGAAGRIRVDTGSGAAPAGNFVPVIGYVGALSELTAIDIQPPNPAALRGSSLPLTAMGQFSSGMTRPLADGNGEWTSTAHMGLSRRLFAGAASGGLLYTFGGCGSSCPQAPDYAPTAESTRTEIYNPVTHLWSQAAAVPYSFFLGGAAAPGNGKVYIFGGLASPTSTYEYSPATDTWAERAPMPTARSGLGAIAADGKIYVIGGSAPTNVVEMYDPLTDTWTTKAPMPTARHEFGLAEVNGKIYAIGGSSDCCGNTQSGAVEEYDPATDTWTTKALLPVSLGRLGVAAVNGKVYAFGGYNIAGGTTAAYGNTFEYDPDTDTWRAMTPMLTVRQSMVASTLRNQVVSAGGSDGSSNAFTITDAFTPPEVTWSTNDAGVVTIDQNGLAHAIELGSARVTATSITDPISGSTLIYVLPLPTADAGADQVVEATSIEGAHVTLNASGSSDPIGFGLIYEWRDEANTVISSSANRADIRVQVPLGLHTFTLTVLDGQGTTDDDSVEISVVDTTPPAVMVIAPNGGETAESALNVSWEATDNTSISTFDVAESSDGGFSFTPVPGCLGLPATATSCAWVWAGPPTASARVRVAATDTSGRIGTDVSDSDFSLVNRPPEMRVDANTRSAIVGGAVTFDADVYDPDGHTVVVAWNFGDGSPLVTGAHVQHTYVTAGTFEVTVSATDAYGAGATDAVSVTVAANTAPVAMFTAVPNPTAVGVPVQFDGSSSHDPDASSSDFIASYAWDFGDGSPTASGAFPTHAYASPGTYVARLTVTDTGGLTHAAAQTIAVSVGSPPLAAFTATPNPGIPGVPVRLDASGSSDPDAPLGDAIVSYAWDLDGDAIFEITTEGAVLTHTFSSTGLFPISLRVTDRAGLSATSTIDLSMQPGVMNRSLRNGLVGYTYEQQLVAGGFIGPTTWSVISGPFTGGGGAFAGEEGTACQGITIDSQGRLYGVPVRAGLCGPFDVQGADATSVATATFQVRVLPALAYVAENGSSTVSAIDPATGSVVAVINVPVQPAAVAVHPDGSRVYVSLPGDISNPAAVVLSNGGTSVAVIDVATNALLRTIDVGQRPTRLAMSPDGQRVYVANTRARTISVIDTTTDAVIGSFSTFGFPTDLAVSPDGRTLYVTRVSDSIATFDTLTQTLTGEIALTGAQATALGLSPDGRWLLTGPDVNVIDTTTQAAAATIDNVSAGDIAISPDGRLAYLAADRIGVVDLNIRALKSTIPAPNAGGFSAVTPDGRMALVTDFQSNVHLVDAVTESVTNTVPVGTRTAGVAVVPHPTLHVATTALPPGLVGVPYDFSIVAGGGVPPYSLSVAPSAAPPGLTIDGSGRVTGAPTSAGTFAIPVATTDADFPAQTVSATVMLAIRTNTAPTAAFTMSPSPAIVTADVLFDATTSFDLDQTAGDRIVSYAWDFGDGSVITSHDATLSHVYASVGTYEVRLTVSDRGGLSHGTTHLLVVTGISLEPFEASPNPVAAGIPASFDATARGNDTSFTYEWDFDGDGSWDAAGAQVQYVFPSPGTFVVTMRATDAAGGFGFAAEPITVVANAPPVASFTAVPNPSLAGLPIVFDSAGSSDPNGDAGDFIVNYRWNFGDGTTLDASSLEHVYPAPGTFTATLTVTDRAGLSNAATQTITVIVNTPPIAQFTASPNPAVPGVPVTFDASSSSDPDASLGDAIVGYAWDFDDDGIFEQGSPTPIATHPFTAVGTYPVALRVTDRAGLTATTSLNVTVQFGIANLMMRNALVNHEYRQQFVAAGAAGAVTWSVIGGPFGAVGDGTYAGLDANGCEGLTLDASGGLHGLPTQEGLCGPFTVRASDTVASSDRSYQFRVLPAVAYVTNNGSNTVSVVNSSTLATISQIPVHAGPADVAITADGERAYVTLPGPIGFSGTLPAVGNGNSVAVIDTASASVVNTITVGPSPTHVVSSPDGSRIYVVNTRGASFSVIDRATDSVVQTVSTGSFPLGLAVSPDGKYVLTTGLGTLQVFETAGFAIQSQLSFQGQVGSTVTVGPDGDTVYVAAGPTSGAPTLRAISLSQLVAGNGSSSILWTVPLAGTLALDSQVSPDGHWIYVTSRGRLDVVDAWTRRLVESGAGSNLFGVAFLPGSVGQALLTQSPSNLLALDSITRTPAATAAVGSEPAGLATMPLPVLHITTTTVAAAVVGVPYSANVAAAGGLRPYQFSAVAGSVPPGFEFAASGDLSGTASVPGTFTFDVEVVDADRPTQRARRTVTLEVHADAPNDPPVALLEALSTRVEAGVPITFSASASFDPNEVDGDHIVRYAWNFGDGAGIPDGAVSETHAYNSPGRYLVTVTVTDSAGASDDASIEVEVVGQHVNVPPIADAGPNQSVVENSQVQLDGYGSVDPEGGSLTFDWVQIGGPPVELVDADSGGPLFVAPGVSVEGARLTFQLTVSDGLDSASDQVEVFVAKVKDLHCADLSASIQEDTTLELSLNCREGGHLDGLEVGYVRTVAGSGIQGWSGDVGPATEAALNQPEGVAVDDLGNLYVADTLNNVIRRVDAATGIIATIAGLGDPGFGGDFGPAVQAVLFYPRRLAFDAAGHLFFTDIGNRRIRRIDAVTGIITTVVGGGTEAGTDGIAATEATGFFNLEGLAFDAAGDLFLVDANRVRRVARGADDFITGDVDEIITTVVGFGDPGFSGDGGPASSAQFWSPSDLAFDPAGNLYIADTLNDRVRRVAAGNDGVISGADDEIVTTFAGGGELTDDGIPATSAFLFHTVGVTVDRSGNVFVGAVQGLRRVDAVTGIISTVVGGGDAQGEDIPAATARLNGSRALDTDAEGNLFIAEWAAHRIRVVRLAPPALTYEVVDPPSNGSVTVSGNGTLEYQPHAGFVGEDQLTFRALNRTGQASEPATLYITVFSVDDQPAARAGPDQTAGVSTVVRLDGSGSSDPKGTPITFSWAFVSRPPDSSGSLESPDTANPTFTPTVAGVYVLELTVTDALGQSATDSVAITAIPLPDLVVGQLSATFDGRQYAIQVVVSNQGSASAAVGSYVALGQSHDEILGAGDVPLKSMTGTSPCVVSVPPLAAGATSGLLAVTCLSDDPGTFPFVLAGVDPLLQVQESNETNNVSAARVDALDADDDGILDVVDSQPLEFSSNFNDVSVGGTTSGVIAARGDQILTVADAAAPEGVRIRAASSGGGVAASITACGGGGQFSMTPGDDVIVTCGSVTLTVLAGEVETTFLADDGSVATVTLAQGNSLTFEPDDASLAAPAGNATAIVVQSGGIQLQIDPGQTVETVRPVLLDVRPGTVPNTINLGSAGTVPAAILSTAGFSAPSEIDPESLSLVGAAVNLVGKAGKLQCSPEDVNADGLADLVCHFVRADLALQLGDSVAILYGQTFGGRHIRGEDRVRIVP